MAVSRSMEYVVLEIHREGATLFYIKRQFDELMSQAFPTKEKLFRTWSLGQIKWRSLEDIVGKVGQEQTVLNSS